MLYSKKLQKNSTLTTTPLINPQNLRRGYKCAAEGETKATIAAREKSLATHGRVGNN
jgi:hypothetical protein